MFVHPEKTQHPSNVPLRSPGEEGDLRLGSKGSREPFWNTGETEGAFQDHHSAQSRVKSESAKTHFPSSMPRLPKALACTVNVKCTEHRLISGPGLQFFVALSLSALPCMWDVRPSEMS